MEKKYTKLVSGTLAGALAVGMVPAMALADDAIELQATTVSQDMQGATITAYEGGLASGHNFTYDGKAHGIVPTTVKGAVSEKSYEVAYYEYWQIDPTNANGVTYIKIDKNTVLKADYLGTTAPSAVGEYAVIAYVKDEAGAYSASTAAQFCGTFKIVGQALADAVVYEVAKAPAKDDLSDVDFIWKDAAYGFASQDAADGLEQGELNIKIGGKALAPTDYDVTAVYNAKGVRIYNGVTGSVPSDAGTYTLTIEGNGAYEGQKAELKYTIQQLNLENASVALQADHIKIDTYPSIKSINGMTAAANSGFYGALDIAYAIPTSTGAKAIEIALTDAGKAAYGANVIGKATVPYTIVNEVGVAISADYAALADAFDGSTTITVGAANKQKFSVDNILNAETAKGDLAATEYKVVVTNTDTDKVVDVAVLENASVQGNYEVKLVVNAEAVGYKYYGESDVLKVKVDNGEIGSASVAYLFNGAVKSADFGVTYDGTDQLDKLDVVVKTTAGVAVAEGDYEIVVTTVNAEGKTVEVDEAINAGNYEIIVKSDKYDVKDLGLTLTVNPMKVKPVLADYLGAAADILYTGKEVSPIDHFTTEVVNALGEKEIVEVDVPTDAYKFAISKFEAEKKEDQPKKTPTVFQAAGKYWYSMADVTAKDNYEVEGIASQTLVVTAKNPFYDVKSDAWYAEYVLAAHTQGIIKGYSNGLYGVSDYAERQDVALMLARMLDYVSKANANDNKTDLTTNTIITPFADVDGKAYYAEAVKEINEAKVMTGYANGLFGVGDDISREEVAVALQRIDAQKLYDEDLTLTANAIDAYADADEVSTWAVQGMNWAVENGIFGVDTKFLNPGDEITRAELAAVIVRYMELREI